jgi:hypothetical protein
LLETLRTFLLSLFVGDLTTSFLVIEILKTTLMECMSAMENHYWFIIWIKEMNIIIIFLVKGRLENKTFFKEAIKVSAT